MTYAEKEEVAKWKKSYDSVAVQNKPETAICERKLVNQTSCSVVKCLVY